LLPLVAVPFVVSELAFEALVGAVAFVEAACTGAY